MHANSNCDGLFLVESLLIPAICLNCCQQIQIAHPSTGFGEVGANKLDSPQVASLRFSFGLVLVRSSPNSSGHCQQLLQIVNFRFEIRAGLALTNPVSLKTRRFGTRDLREPPYF
jgi:hypothetical protein